MDGHTDVRSNMALFGTMLLQMSSLTQDV